MMSMSLSAFSQADTLEGFLVRQGNRPVIVVQGLGSTGSATVAALTSVQKDDRPYYAVIGVEGESAEGLRKIAAANAGHSPIHTADAAMDAAYQATLDQGNLLATPLADAYTHADVVMVDIPFSLKKAPPGEVEHYEVGLHDFLDKLRPVAERISENCLVLVETAMPPGMTEQHIRPLFEQIFRKRGMNPDALRLAYSYERAYQASSLASPHRVYAGINAASCTRAREFLGSLMGATHYSLTELHSTTACEMAKVMETAYHAMSIAFVQEWSVFAENSGVDMCAVLKAISMPSAHQDFPLPGFGVGGPRLNRDALLADWASRQLSPGGLPLSRAGTAVNDVMPLHTLGRIKECFGRLKGVHITLMGVAAHADTSDTRHTPADLFVRQCEHEEAVVQLHDPRVKYWAERACNVPNALGALMDYPRHDVVVFTQRHKEYLSVTAEQLLLLCKGMRLVVDAALVLDEEKARALRRRGVIVLGIGKGHWHKH